MTNILLIDEDTDRRQSTATNLTVRGYHVSALPLHHVGEVLSDLSQPTHGRPDVVVMNPYAHGVDSLLVLRLVRLASGRPVIVCAAGQPDAEVVRMLDAGADGCWTEHVTAALVDAQVTAVLRRVPCPPPPRARVVGQLHLDVGAREASLRGAPLHLTQAEFDLLACLSEHPGRVLPRELLATRLRLDRPSPSCRSIDVLLSRLRSKLGESAARPRYLHSSRGLGVALRAPDDATSRGPAS
ncbi:response regulator transcription factor [Longispora sp. NPDC051575]|uniref:response regulator transcription factor n=1 Tax=Longispora sp. NPDC051575 TaxID=3154943 RepID=UPI0034451D85